MQDSGYLSSKMIKRILKNELVKGSITLFILFNVFNLLNFVFQFAMARMLGPADYGVFAALVTLIYFIAIPSDSIQTVVSKYTSKFKVKKELGKIKYLSYKIFRKGLLLATIIFIISLPVLWLFSYFLNIPYSLSVLTGIMVFTIFLAPVTRGVMQGMKEFNSLGMNMVFDTAIRIVFSVLLVFIGFQVYGAMVGILIGSFAAFFISFIPLKKVFSKKKKPANVSKIYESSKPVLFTLILILAVQSIDIILAKRFFSPEIAGQYAVANLIGKMIFFGTVAISKAMFPLSSEKFEDGHNTEKIYHRSLFMVLIISLASVIILALFPGLIVGLLFGEEYLEITNIVFFMGIAFSFISLSNIVLLYGVSIDRIRIKIQYIVVFLVIQIALLTFLRDSLMSFSIAMVISGFILFLGSLFVIRKKS